MTLKELIVLGLLGLGWVGLGGVGWVGYWGGVWTAGTRLLPLPAIRLSSHVRAAARPPGPGHWLFSQELFLQLNDYEIRKGKKIGVTVSFNNHRLFVGNIPKNRDRDDLFEELTRHARKSLSNS